MDTAAPRTKKERRTDATDKLRERHADVWVATASGNAAYLVPLSYHWDGHRIVLVTAPNSATARNLTKSRTARLALGGTRDVVMIDARLDEVVAIEDASTTLLDAYAAQADWTPGSRTNRSSSCSSPHGASKHGERQTRSPAEH